MISKTYTFALLAATLAGSAEAGHVRHSHNKRADTVPNICGSKGYDRGTGNYLYDDSGKSNSYAGCSAACLGDVKCKSFGYSSNECMLFSVALTGNFDADKGSADTYYDRGCLSAAGAAGGTPSSSTTKKSPTTPAATPSSSSKTSPSATTAKPSSTSKSSPSVAAATPSSSSKSSPAAAATTPSSAGGASPASSTTSTTTANTPFNPYASVGCPLPSALAVSGLKSTIDANGNNAGQVKVTYGNGTFSCPDTAGHCGTYNGLFDCNCDPDGLSRVISDGKSWVYFSQAYWCDAQEQRPTHGYQSLGLSANFTSLTDYLTCDKATKTCTQSKPLTIPVDWYGGAGIIGFAPIDVSGQYLPNCPSQAGHSPIVTNTATCTPAPAAATP